MNFSKLAKTQLFRGIPENQIEAMLPCLSAREQSYQKGAIIRPAGRTVEEIGLILSGSVNIVVNYYWGGSNIFVHVDTWQIFGEIYAAIPGKELLCDLVAAEDCTVLFLRMDGILHYCGQNCEYHHRLVCNVLRLFADKNLQMSQRMMHIASYSIRGRLLSYLSQRQLEAGSEHFTIPFSRQQLADYLGVDRSALSNELSKMQKEGLIRYHKNEFFLHDSSTHYAPDPQQ